MQLSHAAFRHMSASTLPFLVKLYIYSSAVKVFDTFKIELMLERKPRILHSSRSVCY